MEGRRPLLSQLLPGKRRPQLLPLGECVQAGLLAIHKVYPAAGISDFVIMPDHVHFLLVVDYRRMPAFNPLWVVHRLMDAVEMAWNGRGQAPAPPDMVAFLNQAVRQGRAFAAAIKDSSTSGVRGASSPIGSPSGVRGGSPDGSIFLLLPPGVRTAYEPSRKIYAVGFRVMFKE